MEMSPPHLAGQKREPQDRLAGVSPQLVYMAEKCGQGMVKICREAAYLNQRLERTGGEAVCHYAGVGGRRTLNRRSLGPKRHGFTLRKERQVLIR
jgi:hypothetical protein